MSLLMNCQNIGKSFSDKSLFSSISLSVQKKDRIGVIGPNGGGKSTFLRCLAGHVEPDCGDVVFTRGLRKVYLPQQSIFSKGKSILQAGLDLCREIGGQSDDIEIQMQIATGAAGFSDLNADVSTLSGGWQKRLSLCSAFACQSDLLFLDEPTNHLDWDGVIWLQDQLQQCQSAWVIISHDRYILQKLAKRMLEVNSVFPGGAFSSDSSYENFVEAKQNFIEGQQSKQASMANKLRREEEWLRQGVKARTTKSRSRIDQAYELKGELSKLNQQLTSDRKMAFEFQASGRKTKELIKFKEAAFSYGDKGIFSAFDLTMTSKKITGVLGANGAGKTTFLKLAAGELQPTQGVIERARDLKTVYFEQSRESLPSAGTLKDVFTPSGGDSVIWQGRSVHVVTFAKLFGFDRFQLEQEINKLSGGEKARALMGRLMLQTADFIILDEPTNDLDIDTIEILESRLSDFEGSAFIVSHDRYFLEQVCSDFLAVHQGKIASFTTIEQWEKANNQIQGIEKNSQAFATKGTPKAKRSNKKLSYKEQREFDSIEEKVLNAEAELESLQKLALNDEVVTSPGKSREVYESLEQAKSEIDRLYQRWSELEEKQS